MQLIDGEWFFSASGKPVKGHWRTEPCGHCGKVNTPEGHDGCLGTLPGVMNACCGHGVVAEAYVQFVDGSVVSGDVAEQYLVAARTDPRMMIY